MSPSHQQATLWCGDSSITARLTIFKHGTVSVAIYSSLFWWQNEHNLLLYVDILFGQNIDRDADGEILPVPCTSDCRL